MCEKDRSKIDFWPNQGSLQNENVITEKRKIVVPNVHRNLIVSETDTNTVPSPRCETFPSLYTSFIHNIVPILKYVNTRFSRKTKIGCGKQTSFLTVQNNRSWQTVERRSVLYPLFYERFTQTFYFHHYLDPQARLVPSRIVHELQMVACAYILVS